MGEIIDLKEKRKRAEDERKAKSHQETAGDVVEVIREFLKPALLKGPNLRVVENGERVDRKGFAKFMTQIQGGELSD